MTNALTMNVLAVALDLTRDDSMFEVKWNLKDIKQDKPVKVFTIFSCGGGSSMGYKRAGFEVIGNCEIDPRMNKVYVGNHHPKYNFNCDVRDLLSHDIPQELYELDILDGSPPCSTFSMAGQRERNWGKEKKFAEGQKEQVLDDLFFEFLNVVEKLRPKVVVAENVLGIIMGNAKGYCNLIVKRFKELGYDVQIFKLNAAFMDVPQRRERVFFIANRMGYPKLELNFNHKIIRFGEIRSEKGSREVNKDSKTGRLAAICKRGDDRLADGSVRIGGKFSSFNTLVLWDEDVPCTLASGSGLIRGADMQWASKEDIVNIQTFPQDYDFMTDSVDNVKYICGMSVPPNMMANIATEIWNQWLGKGYTKEREVEENGT